LCPKPELAILTPRGAKGVPYPALVLPLLKEEMGVEAAQLSPTQIFKQQWSDYQVVRVPSLLLLPKLGDGSTSPEMSQNTACQKVVYLAAL
jgi:hypothetical protein